MFATSIEQMRTCKSCSVNIEKSLSICLSGYPIKADYYQLYDKFAINLNPRCWKP